MKPRKPLAKKPVIIDAETTPVRALPPGRTKKIDITSGKNKVAEVEVEIEDNEIQDGDMINAQKAAMAKVPPAGYVTVGLALGATLNVGDYQSARIDAFIIRNVPDIPGAAEAEFSNISEKLNNELERQTQILLDERSEPEPPTRKRGR